MTRVLATHLDTIAPQKSTDYYAYGNQLKHMFFKLGIPVKNHFLLSGDRIAKKNKDHSWSERKISDTDFAQLKIDIITRGNKLEDYLSRNLSENSIQYRFWKSMEMQADRLIEFIESHGGINLATFGIGPSEKGVGHLGFAESCTAFDKKYLMCILSYHAMAGNCKENGGLGNCQDASNNIALGCITMGPALFAEARKRLLVIIGKEKASSAKNALEHVMDSTVPATILQKGQGVGTTIILDETAASKLRCSTHPWDYEVFSTEQWKDPELQAKLFTTLALEYGGFQNLRLEDFRNPRSGTTVCDPATLEIRKQNIVNLLADSELSWDQFKQQIQARIKSQAKTAAGVVGDLRIDDRSVVSAINPHPDDLSLALQSVVRELTSKTNHFQSLYIVNGCNAVDTRYVAFLLREISSLNKKDFEEVLTSSRTEEDFLKKEKALLQELLNSYNADNNNIDPRNYRFWTNLSSSERVIRAKLLLLRAAQTLQSDKTSPKKSTVDQKFWQHLANAYESINTNKNDWGSQESAFLSKLKEALRAQEEKSQLMSDGVPFENISNPIKCTWAVAGSERNGTATQSDIASVKAKLKTEQPSLIIFNGEGFMDHGAHCITEHTVKLAVKELLEERALPANCKILLYRGVWDRTEIKGTSNQVLVKLRQKDLDEMRDRFLWNYRSQSPGLVPDASLEKPSFFIDQVLRNSKTTLDEYKTLTGDSADGYAGMLAYDTVDLSNESEKATFIKEVEEMTLEVARVQEPIKRATMQKIIGIKPPYLFGRYLTIAAKKLGIAEYFLAG